MLQTLTVLISVYDKTGLIELVKRLSRKFNLKIISTGGTAKYLNANGFEVMEVAQVTGFPEILNGRVKTLHPKIFGGILAEKNNRQHLRELKKLGIGPIDMVVVNLYPFEQIDIGGVTLLRAAAKSWRTTIVAGQIKDYASITKKLSLKQRRQLAAKAFRLTGQYDRLIAKYLSYAR
ncbi:IMP cyclohydrolase [Candidatus Roizmanbacteria bacterium CG23_combo_of_CG06-09_8_20_14_all_35_49]|uniref:IMP cyclohydrolase n=1 Tax=Candidatus Roizmanbacteria bacterium CG23_combo_of_CG06-09_8_20_14_all_35_49 TaxID=1974863 RepID=A0A2G9Y614_9BACT|nr:MAG: IMP cyclohydrolase [Candidatus Roizmanbacteria bacterium CG23_combo_of_CG06-09_8_20_14_all_35_49]